MTRPPARTDSLIQPRSIRHGSVLGTALHAASLVVFALCITAILCVGAAVAQTPPVYYEQYDVELTLADNGDLSVRIRQQVAFDGEYRNAFLDIPKEYTSGIEITGLFLADEEGLTPADYTVTDNPDTVSLAWTYPPTRAGDMRGFVIDYVAKGALWVYNDRDVLRWDAIHADRSGAPVQSSSVFVRLPSYVPINATRVEASGSEYAVEMGDDVIDVRTQAPLIEGQFFNVQVDFPHGLVNADVQDWQKESDSELLEYEIPRFETEVWIKPDGALTVREEIDVAVLGSVMYGGFRDIARLYLDDVANFRVYQDGREMAQSAAPCTDCLWLIDSPRSTGWVRYSKYTDSVVIDEERAGSVSAEWDAAPVDAGETATIVAEYDIVGAIRPGEQSQTFVWPAIPDYGAPISEASIRVYPPPAISASALVITSTQTAAPQRTASDGSVFIRSQGAFEAGSEWIVHVTMPEDATSATSPQWIADLDNAISAATAARIAAARRRTLALFLSIMFVTLLLAASTFAWYSWGGKALRERLGGYLSEPPSALAPGLVAYLVDGRIKPNGVLASMIQLGAMGLAKVSLRPSFAIAPVGRERLGIASFQIGRSGNGETFNRHLAVLYNDILLPSVIGDRPSSMADLEPILVKKLPEYFAAMAADARAYRLAPPRAGILSKISAPVLMATWVLVMVATIFVGLQYRLPTAILVPVVFVVFALFFLLHAVRQLRSGRRSPSEDSERQRWLKFRNYLLDIKKYGNQAAARHVMDEYFAYAVALGVEAPVLDQAAPVSRQFPRWMATSEMRRSVLREVAVATPDMNDRVPATPRASARTQRRTIAPRHTRPSNSLTSVSRDMSSSLAAASVDLGGVLGKSAGSAADVPVTVTIRGRVGESTLSWDGGTPLDQIGNDILLNSARAMERTARRTTPSGSGMPSRRTKQWSSRSSGGFGRRVARTRSSSTRSRSSRRSGGGGRSGFG